MNIKPIRSDDDLAAAFARMEQLWGSEIGTPEGDELEVLAVLIEKYEDEHYPMPPSDPIEAIKFRMDQQGLTPRGLEPYIGSSGRVSEVLNRKRKLSLAMIKRLHDGLHIPYESLLASRRGLTTPFPEYPSVATDSDRTAKVVPGETPQQDGQR